MRIAIIEPGKLPAQTANSIQRMKMAQALTASGHTVRVFAPGDDPKIQWEEFAKHYGLNHKFELQWAARKPLLRSYDFARRAIREAKRWNAELVYTRLPQAAARASRQDLPTIFELHDVPMGFMGPWLLRRFLRGKGARRVVANTKFLANRLISDFSVPEGLVIVAPNGVDLERYENLPSPEAARKKMNLSEKFTVGYTGHLYAGRGAETILALAKSLPDMQFLLVGGKANDVQRVQELASGLSNVTLTGFIPNADLPLYQAAADVLVMPYGQAVAASSGGDIAPFLNPMKMFEYLASARPIVSSDLPILREILNEENSVIVPGEDLVAWANVLGELQNSPGRRETLSKAARQTAQQHTWEKRAQRILAGLQGIST